MKKKLLFLASILLVALVWTGVQFAASFPKLNEDSIESSACMNYNTTSGSRCGSSSSLEYKIKNNCSSDASATTWIKRSANGEWIEGSTYYLNPGETATGWWCQEPYEWKITYKVK